MKPISSIELLRQLKREYSQNNVSALVGAGFSKNAINEFPSWPELLLPIVRDMYQDEFEQRMSRAGVIVTSEGKSKAEKKVCDDLLQKYGNLEVVSEYIRRMGRGHESIDAYIEKRIKKAETDSDGGWTYDGVSYPKEALRLHLALLQCTKFRNIYTTNYDNLLEIAQEITSIPNKLDRVVSETSLSDTSSHRAIVKLHGDIASSSEDQYEFDGDKNLKYIIAKEDYDTYMAKHQGFSYLMRLAMLQGRFCLIGFSGTDPNYMLWLQWMKDVLDRAQEYDNADKTKKDSKIPEKRVYLVTPFKYESDTATELFYKNHHVGVIDLTRTDVQDELRGSIEMEEDKRVGEYTQETSVLFEMFFNYLQSGESEEDKNTGKSYKSVADSYSRLWVEVREAYKKHLDMQPILQKIEEQYNPALNPLDSWQQDSIITSILRHNLLEATVDYQRLFALGVRDMGTLPFYYHRVINEDEQIKKDEVWQRLMLREAILRCQEDYSRIEAERTSLDNAMLAAFRLDFRSMNRVLELWEPKEEDKPKRWMLLSLFRDRKKYLNEWDEYIAKLTDIPQKMNACAMRDLLSGEILEDDDVWQYLSEGGVTVTKKINEASHNIAKPKKDMSAYGTHPTTIQFSGGNPTFEKSIRLINLLYDNAYVPMYYAQWLVNDGDWYDVFTCLYEYFPYPMIYYSAFIRDDKMLKRLGQDIAYSDILYPESVTILMRMLEALGMDETPSAVRYGLWVFTRELYAVVNSELWEDLFMRVVFTPLMNRWNDKISSTDEDMRNVAVALSYITNPDIVNQVFLELTERFESNPNAVYYILQQGFRMKHLREDDSDVKTRILHITNVGHLQRYALMYRLLKMHGKLSEEQCDVIGTKIEKEDLSYAEKSPIDIYHLAALANSDTQRHYVRDLVMLSDAWDCSLSGRYFNEPIILNIAKFPNEWKWNDDEIEFQVASILDNIAELLQIKNVNDQILRNSYISWIEEVIHFAQHFEYWKTDKGALLTNQIMDLMLHFGIEDNTEILLISNEYRVMQLGFNMLKADLEPLNDERGIEKYDKEIGVIVTRATLFDANQFQSVVIMLCYLVEKYPQYMYTKYEEKLLYLLWNSQYLDYRKLNLNMSTVYNRLRDIALVLYENGVKDPAIREWVNEENEIRYYSRYDRD